MSLFLNNNKEFNENKKESCIIEFNFNMNNIEHDYNHMINAWLGYYEDNNIDKFTLVFKGDNDSNIPIKYVYKLSKFIKNIKNKRKEEYDKYNKLSQSIVIIKSKNMRILLDLLFTLVTPLSDLYITSSIEQTNMIIDNIEKGNTILPESVKGIKYIKSNNYK
jgi:hypothetical protein|tara:strand:- start:992 stop:1480 length:489 start_codon:yes stop_codon:yes gene_type:complete